MWKTEKGLSLSFSKANWKNLHISTPSFSLFPMARLLSFLNSLSFSMDSLPLFFFLFPRLSFIPVHFHTPSLIYSISQFRTLKFVSKFTSRLRLRSSLRQLKAHRSPFNFSALRIFSASSISMQLFNYLYRLSISLRFEMPKILHLNSLFIFGENNWNCFKKKLNSLFKITLSLIFHSFCNFGEKSL